MNFRARPTATALAVSALAAAALGLAPTGASAATARPADSFVDSIGVAVHLADPGTPYVEHFSTIEQRLGELGVRHVRTGYYPEAPDIDAYVRELAAAGIKSTLIMGSPEEPTTALPEMLAAIEGSSSLRASIDALEGPNEYSTSGDPDWKEHLLAYQKRLYEGVKNAPALASLPVLGPSIVHNDQATLGDISSYLDFGNIHSYPEGEPPENKLAYYLQRATLNSGSKPVIATETGYENALEFAPTGPGEDPPVSEAAAAIYFPRLYLEYFGNGVVRTYAYQLVDEHEDTSLKNREDHFGLLKHDLTLKPAATAIENLTTILGDPGPAFTPGSLEYTLSGDTAAVKSVLLEKRDGSFYLALWRLQKIWNPTTKEAIAPAPEPLEVTFPDDRVEYGVYEPTVSNTPRANGGPTQKVSVEVGAGVTILKLDPTATETTPPGEPPTTPPGEPGGPAPTGPGEPDAPTTTPAPTIPVTEPVPLPAVSLPLPMWSAPRCIVPTLRGLRVPAAKAEVRRAGCVPQSVPMLASFAKRQAGTPRVVRVEPKAGTVLAAGSPVKLFAKPAPR